MATTRGALRRPDLERRRLIDEVVAQREPLADDIVARIQAAMECYRTVPADELLPGHPRCRHGPANEAGLGATAPTRSGVTAPGSTTVAGPPASPGSEPAT